MVSEIKIPSVQELTLVMPEIWLVFGMCAVIMVPFVRRKSMALPAIAAAISLLAAMYATCASFSSLEAPQVILHGMLAIDTFSQMFKLMLLGFTLLVLAQWWIATRHETLDIGTPDLWCLILGATFGMCLMASATNLLMIFMAIESASIPSYILAGFRRRHRIGTEGSLKYVLFGAAASAVNVYGMSLIYGMTGTLDLSSIATIMSDGVSPLLAVGILGMFAGIAFKLSAVPMHFWCPDVFQGAPMEVTTFLSVASKGAAIILLVRVLQTLTLAVSVDTQSFLTGLAIAIAIMGAVTATWGNLVALRQSNIKRLLAYSSIAHSGYMIMAASMILFAKPDASINQVTGAILFYLLVYMFMNLGAFTIAAVVAEHDKTENIEDYAGLSKRSPLAAILLVIFLLSLFGMPTLGGFMGKIYLLTAMADIAGPTGFILIAVLLINTVFSLYFYMRPCYYMFFQADPQDQPAYGLRFSTVGLLLVCAAMLLFTGILPGSANDFFSKSVIYQPNAHELSLNQYDVAGQSIHYAQAEHIRFVNAGQSQLLKAAGEGKCDKKLTNVKSDKHAGEGKCDKQSSTKACVKLVEAGKRENAGDNCLKYKDKNVGASQ